jgi:U3 small nucleolar RNA-associated protein 10
MLEHLPSIMPVALSHLQTSISKCSATSKDMMKDDNHDGRILLNISCLTTLNETILVLPTFLSPYLPTIFQILFHPSLRNFEELNPTLTTALHLLPSAIEPVTLLPPLVLTYKTCLQHGTVSMKLFFTFIAEFCTSLSPSSVRQYSNSIFKFFLHAFDIRQTIRNAAYSNIDMDVLEGCIAESFLAFVLKLNEMELKTFWMKLIEWLGPPLTLFKSNDTTSKSNGKKVQKDQDDSSEDDEMNESDDDDEAASKVELDKDETSLVFEHSLIFFRVVKVLSAKLKTIFVPYSLYAFDHMIAYSQSPQYWNPSIEASIEQNRKIANGSKLNAPKASSRNKKESTLDQSSDLRNQYVHLLTMILKSLEQAFQFDSEHIYAKEQFDRLIPCYSSLLEIAYHTLLTPSTLRAYDDTSEYHSFVSNVLTPSLLSLASRMSTFHLWKPLHHALLLQTRQTSPHIRYAALSIITSLFIHLGQSYLVMLPETLPFISELMEDSEQHVESEIQRLIRTLEELSGEDLESYLQ